MNPRFQKFPLAPIVGAIAATAISLSLPSTASLSASPLVSIGDTMDVYFNGSTSLRHSSNVFRDEQGEESDLYWTISPGFEINLGRGDSDVNFNVTTRYDILRYDDLSELDAELFHIVARGSYEGSRLSLNGSAAFDEYQTATGDANIAGDLIEFETTKGSVDGEYQFSPKFSFGAGASYNEKEYQTFQRFFNDRETYSFPFDVYYKWTPKVDLSAGYRYSQTEVDGRASTTEQVAGYDTEKHFFNVGMRGNLLPKLTGFFKVGYTTRDSDDSARSRLVFQNNQLQWQDDPIRRDSSGMLGMDANFSWATTPKFTTQLKLSRDFGASGEGNVTENSSATLIGNYTINNYVSASGNLGYTRRDYQDNNDREDDRIDAGVALNYRPDEHWTFSTGYNYAENDSNENDQSWDEHVFHLTASLRY
ncbi:MAG: outer membrane beta-barrel protein [Opitutales bacterium]